MKSDFLPIAGTAILITLKSEPGESKTISVQECEIGEKFVWFNKYDNRMKTFMRKGINLDMVESIERISI